MWLRLPRQYAYHEHLWENALPNAPTTGTFFSIRLPRAPFGKVPGVSVLEKVPGVCRLEKGARGMHIGKSVKSAKGARVAAIAEKVPVVGVLGAGTQYAYHGHLLKTGSRGGNRSHTGTFSPIAVARAPFFQSQ